MCNLYQMTPEGDAERAASMEAGDVKRSMLCGLVLAMMASVAHAHPGGLNAEGCHNNRKTGEYHCHGGGRYVPSASGKREQLNSLYDTPSSGKQSNSAGSALPPGCYVGPRGGTYTLTKSGRKNYSGC